MLLYMHENGTIMKMLVCKNKVIYNINKILFTALRLTVTRDLNKTYQLMVKMFLGNVLPC